MSQLYIEQQGNPELPNLVLLHGWGMSSQIWQPIIDVLAQKFHLTLIDLPGLGRSPELQSNSLDGLLAELFKVAPKQASWLGWSLGGQLAIAAAQHAPERIDKLICVATNPCFVAQQDWSTAMPLETYQMFKASLQQQPEKTLTRFISLQTQGMAEAKATQKKLKSLVQTEQPSNLFDSLAWLEFDLREKLKQLSHSLLMQFGQLDQLVPVSAAKSCQQLNPQAQISIYNDSSHLPFISESERWLAEVYAFLQEIKS